MRSLRVAFALGTLATLAGCTDNLQLLSVTAVTPTTGVQGVASTLTVTGTQFNSNMSVVLNGVGQPTTFVSATTLTTTLPASLPVGIYPVAIYDNEGGLAGPATLSTTFTVQITAK